MGVWASAGQFTRSVSELGLTNVEQQRMLRNNNVITSKFMSEKDARSSEMREQTDKANDLSFKKIAAAKSQEAALWGLIGSVLNLVGTVIKGVGGTQTGKSSWADVAADGLNGLGTVITKWLEYVKAGEETKSVEEDLKRINAQKCQTDESVRALDANPYA